MAFKLLDKLRDELYKISDDDLFYEEDEEINSAPKVDINPAILNFVRKSKFLRLATEEEILLLFEKAYKEDKTLALKALFFMRDIQGGFGERRAFRIIIMYLAFKEPEVIRKYLELIPKFGRYDDLYSLFDTPLESDVINLFKKQIEIDKYSAKPSNLAKWLKSENTSSKTSKILGKKTRVALGLSPKEYRVLLSNLRRKINILENKMSGNQWERIDYNKIPVNKCLKYKNAFIKHDKERFRSFLDVKINSRNLTKSTTEDTQYVEVETNAPYQIIDSLFKNINDNNLDIFNNLWALLPKYNPDNYGDFIVVDAVSADGFKNNSKSYTVALSTILYTQQNNKKPFKDYYIHFKGNAKFARVQGNSLYERAVYMKEQRHSNPMDIISTVDLILFNLFKKEVYREQAPENILIITDNDVAELYENSDLVLNELKKWKIAGYSIPKIIFWQIEGCKKPLGITQDVNGTVFAYGYSNLLFKLILQGKEITAEEYIVKSLNKERYNEIENYNGEISE